MAAALPERPIVTLSALFGAGGSIVGPQVAERLGVEFLDREIPRRASGPGSTERAVRQVDDRPGSPLARFAATMGRSSTVTGEGGGAFERLDIQQGQVRGEIEALLARSGAHGAVIIGRGGMVVLGAVPGALHVHLRGPCDARARQGARLLGIDLAEARERQRSTDRDRIGYVRDMYGVDGEDPSLYHLVLDSTVLHLDVCTDLIVAAAMARSDGRPDEAPK